MDSPAWRQQQAAARPRRAAPAQQPDQPSTPAACAYQPQARAHHGPPCNNAYPIGNASTMNVHGKMHAINGNSILTGASMAMRSAR